MPPPLPNLTASPLGNLSSVPPPPPTTAQESPLDFLNSPSAGQTVAGKRLAMDGGWTTKLHRRSRDPVRIVRAVWNAVACLVVLAIPFWFLMRVRPWPGCTLESWFMFVVFEKSLATDRWVALAALTVTLLCGIALPSRRLPVPQTTNTATGKRFHLAKRLMLIATILWPLVGALVAWVSYEGVMSGFKPVGSGYYLQPYQIPYSWEQAHEAAIFAGFVGFLGVTALWLFVTVVLFVIWFATSTKE